MENPKIEVECYDVREIRMGSPHNLCGIRLKGDWVPDLAENDWQDLFAYRGDGEAVALVRWDTPQNLPGFRIVVVDSGAKTVQTSERFRGCCKELRWMGKERIAWQAFPDFEGVYETGGA